MQSFLYEKKKKTAVGELKLVSADLKNFSDEGKTIRAESKMCDESQFQNIHLANIKTSFMM